MEMMLLSFLVPALTDEWNLNYLESSLIGSMVFVGMMFGAYFWGVVSDRFGRRLGYMATAIFTGVFGVLSALAPSFYWMLLLRALVGFGLGGFYFFKTVNENQMLKVFLK